MSDQHAELWSTIAAKSAETRELLAELHIRIAKLEAAVLRLTRENETQDLLLHRLGQRQHSHPQPATLEQFPGANRHIGK